MTEMEAAKYTPQYLLQRGYKCYRRVFKGAGQWADEPAEYRAFYSSMAADALTYIFIKGQIRIEHGLLIHQHPPKTISIRVGDRSIFWLLNIPISK